MKLHILITSEESFKTKKTYQLLQAACEELGVELVNIELDKINLDKKSLEVMIQPGEAFLRLATGDEARLAERLLVSKDIKTIYDDWRLPLIHGIWDDTQLMQAAGLPIVPTVFLVVNKEAHELDQITESLGGYPVIVKITGLSHGQGVFLCHDDKELTEVLGRFAKQAATVALRQYFENPRHLRTLVIGGEVADIIEYDKPDNDFRTNAVAVPSAKPAEASPEINKLSLAAANAVGVRFAGIDLLIDPATQQTFVAELNTPCNYARNYLTNGKNPALKLVETLTK